MNTTELQPFCRPKRTRNHVVTATASFHQTEAGDDGFKQLTQQKLDVMFSEENASEDIPVKRPSATPAQPVIFEDCVFHATVNFGRLSTIQTITFLVTPLPQT